MSVVSRRPEKWPLRARWVCATLIAFSLNNYAPQCRGLALNAFHLNVSISTRMMFFLSHIHVKCAQIHLHSNRLLHLSLLATTKAEICMMLSTCSRTSIEDVAEAGKSSLKWFQLNLFCDQELTKSLIHRDEKGGYKALVFTYQ